MPFISAGAKIDSQMTERASVFLAANGDKHFRKKGYAKAYNMATANKKPTRIALARLLCLHAAGRLQADVLNAAMSDAEP
ncbi:hypothetical protein CK215_24800 [Mesorhizobium sp. WSM3864]|uniref:hypothetical protein n=1 Tax=Mesorhizobium sp. WSM3864 TaxID=2029404 RepID=UPI000BAF8EB5|nr:hypothetical protein [Mesorhizobium sp. WSM3864]PBB89975.1 hypothetical protein CK215_24800 [Mesorhizobium sp. WSM3864]